MGAVERVCGACSGDACGACAAAVFSVTVRDACAAAECHWSAEESNSGHVSTDALSCHLRDSGGDALHLLHRLPPRSLRSPRRSPPLCLGDTTQWQGRCAVLHGGDIGMHQAQRQGRQIAHTELWRSGQNALPKAARPAPQRKILA